MRNTSRWHDTHALNYLEQQDRRGCMWAHLGRRDLGRVLVIPVCLSIPPVTSRTAPWRGHLVQIAPAIPRLQEVPQAYAQAHELLSAASARHQEQGDDDRSEDGQQCTPVAGCGRVRGTPRRVGTTAAQTRHPSTSLSTDSVTNEASVQHECTPSAMMTRWTIR